MKPELDRFRDQFAPLFGRDEDETHARHFIQGLLHGGARRHTENIAPALSGGPVRSLPAFISTGVGPDGEILKRMRGSVLEVLADDNAVGNADETGFPKKGTQSVGVKRQDAGPLGRTDNCPVAVCANSCSAQGPTVMDRRLFLPEEGAGDRPRREQAGVPPGVIVRTQPPLALALVADAVTEGIPCRGVGGDGGDGDRPTFVPGVRPLGTWAVLASSSEARVGTTEPPVIPPEQRPRSGRGRRGTPPRVVGAANRGDEVVAALPAAAGQRLTVADGSQGPRVSADAEGWVWFSEAGGPGPRERLLA